MSTMQHGGQVAADVDERHGLALLKSWGMSVEKIAEDTGRPVEDVQAAVDAAEAAGVAIEKPRPLPPKVAVLFPIGPFTPSSQCPHNGPIPRGAPIYCAVCDKCGLDDTHPALVRDPKDDPPPERLTRARRDWIDRGTRKLLRGGRV